MKPPVSNAITKTILGPVTILGATLLLMWSLPDFLVRSVSAQVTTLYVDGQSGLNTPFCGAVGTPCKTIGYTIQNRAAPGDTLNVAQGVYMENLTIDKRLILEGGFEATEWTQDAALYPTIIDGSGSQTVMGDWDGTGIHMAVTLADAGEYKMWYTGWGLTGGKSLGLATSPDGITWTKYVDNPILVPAGDWEGSSVGHPHVIKDGPLYKLWYAPNDEAIGYAISTDGANWERYADSPILEGTPGTWDEAGVGAPFVIKVAADDYRMWYQDKDYSQIGYAISTDGITWIKHDTPVLMPGPSGAWDGERVSDPNVLYDGTTFHLWYAGHNSGRVSIGYANSTDGITWNKAIGNPVMTWGEPGAWDDAVVSEPNVLMDGSTYRMWYTGWQTGYANPRRGYATSTDGITWTKHPTNPVLAPGTPGSWGRPVVHFVSGSNDSVLRGVTARNGDAEDGGGVYIQAANILVDGATIQQNYAFDTGGGIRVSDQGNSTTIRNSTVLDNRADYSGGGIAIRWGAVVDLQNVVVQDNSARIDGGGIYISNGATATLNGSEIRGNTTGGAGGGLFVGNQGVATIFDNLFTENQSTGWAAGAIAVVSGAQATIERNEIQENTTANGSGGGVLVTDETTRAAVRSNLIIGNRAKGSGGLEGCRSAALTVESNQVVGNDASAWGGGGLRFCDDANVFLTGNHIVANTSNINGTSAMVIHGDVTMEITSNIITENGDAIDCVSIYDNDDAPVTVTNNVIAGNQCKGIEIGRNTRGVSLVNNTVALNRSNGILVWGVNAQADVIRNNIVFESGVGIQAGNGGVIVTMDHNNSFGNAVDNYIQVPDGANNISLDPLFFDPANGDYRLHSGSPSIDAGTVARAPVTDMTGNARPHGSGIDMGAHEMSRYGSYLPLAVRPE